MTDQEHAEAIRAVVDALNAAIGRATQDGLVTSIVSMGFDASCGMRVANAVVAEVVRPIGGDHAQPVPHHMSWDGVNGRTRHISALSTALKQAD